MQVITIDGVRNDQGKPARIGVIGSCRVHGPVKALVAEGQARAVAFPFNTYTHSPQDARQYLRFCMGHLILPPPLEPLVFGKAGMRYPALGFMQLVAGLDLIIAEVSSQTRLSASGFEVQQNYFATNFVRPGGKPLLDWWRTVVRNDISRAGAASELLDTGLIDALWQREVVATAQLEEIDDATFAEAMTTLAGSHAARWLFVSHFGFDADKPVASRERNIELLGRFARDNGVGYFNPSPLVIEAGASVALKAGGKDIYHYDPAFEPMMGAALGAAAADVLAGPADRIIRKPGKAATRAPDRAVLSLEEAGLVSDQIGCALENGDAAMANALRYRLLDLDPAHREAALGLAHHAESEGRWRSAIVFAEHVLASDPDNAEARHLKIGSLDKLGEGDPVEAFEDLRADGDLARIAEFCRRAMRQYPESAAVMECIRNAVDEALQAHGRSEDAGDHVATAAALDQLIALDAAQSNQWAAARHALIQRLMSEVNGARDRGDQDTAMNRSRELVRMGAHAAESNLLIGRILLERGEVAGATRAFEATVDEQPERAWAWINLARAHLRAGDKVASAAAYVKARDLAGSADEQTLVQEARQSLRSMASSLILTARQMETDAGQMTDDLPAFRVYGLAAEALGEEGDLAALTAALRRRSLLRVMALERAGDGGLSEAIDVHMELDPDCRRTLEVAGQHFMRMRDFEHALPYWERLVCLEPRSARPHLQVARCMDWMGMTDGMLAAAKRCLDLEPDNAEARALAAKSTAMVAELE